MAKSSNDCYYYFYLKCSKGISCKFRHSLSAKNSSVICKKWRKNSCRRGIECPNRHMESLDATVKMLCKFEKSIGGCRRVDCNFLHRYPRPEDRNVKQLKDRINQLENELRNIKMNDESGGESGELDNEVDNDELYESDRETDHIQTAIAGASNKSNAIQSAANTNTNTRNAVHRKPVIEMIRICAVCDANSRSFPFLNFVLVDSCGHVLCGSCIHKTVNDRCMRCHKAIQRLHHLN